MSELTIRIVRSRLSEEAYCNATPLGETWPNCALRADHLSLGLPHECFAYTWQDGTSELVMKSVAEQRDWDQLGRNKPDAILPEEVGPVTETIARVDFREGVTLHQVIASLDGIEIGKVIT